MTTFARPRPPRAVPAWLLLAVVTLVLAGAAAPRAGAAEPAGHAEHAAADHAGDHADADHGDAHAGHDDGAPIRLDAAARAEFGVRTAVAGPVALHDELVLPCEIRPNDNTLAHIVPRFAGIVTAVRVEVGQQVKAGQVLAVVESDESLTTYEIRTLIPGTVIGRHITLGEAVDRAHAAFVVADLGTVWADITVYPRDLDRIRPGLEVSIGAGPEDDGAVGTIGYVAPVVDEATRTALARVELANPDGRWRPGTFVTARVTVDRPEVAVAVPREALQTLDGADVVFVLAGDGFVPRPVVVGRGDRAWLEVRSGLAAGEEYVATGGFTLKAELLKDSFGGGHAH
ncbi:efflux RND transporter periplasmic adaptor subunit [bacterium]|nr:efflux RND transporter periplasmic adaptor subunit [bacterium]